MEDLKNGTEVEVVSEELEAPILTNAAVKEVPSMEEGLSDLGEALVKGEKEEDIEFTPEDIKKSMQESMFTEGEKDFQLPEEDIITLLEIVNKVRAKENINIYSSLPQSVKNMINKYMLEQGMQGYSVEANSVRNMLANALIDEFISNISVEKTIDSFNKEMEDLFVKTGEEFSKMYKEYDSDRTKYLTAALEKIPEGPENEEKRQTIINVLDAINDAYKLTRLKEATGKIKIKSFEREKIKKVFDEFEFKYKDQTYHIYPLKQVMKTLVVHLAQKISKDSEIDLDKAAMIASIESADFLILFCKFCRLYDARKPEEHAFMYYTLYNIMLLDVYKGEEYEEFANGLLDNIVESYKPYYKKTLSEENFVKRFETKVTEE